MELSDITKKRLSFIKYLFNVGWTQSHQAEPINSISILSFHDSMELFLLLCLYKLGVHNTKKLSFPQLLTAVSDKLAEKKKILEQVAGIGRLNDARVSIKHKGILLRKEDIEEYRVITNIFFRENTKIVFDISWDEFSSVDLIKYDRARDFLKKAVVNYDEGKILDSITDLACSFEYLLYDYETTFKADSLFSPFDFGGHQNDEPIKILALGIDFRKYLRFKYITAIDLFFNDNKELMTAYPKRHPQLIEEDLTFCINFIVEASLRFQEFEFSGT